MGKMFVRYSGTAAAFKTAKDSSDVLLSEKYNDSLVFIGDGEAVYTHGKYFGDVSQVSSIPSLNYIKSVKKDGATEEYTAAGGGVLVFKESTPATVAVDVTSGGITIGLTSDFVTKVNNKADASTVTSLQSTVNTINSGYIKSVSFAGKALSVSSNAATISQADARTALGLGSAAYTASTAYATSAQGTKADSALQGVTLNGTAVTETNNVAALTVDKSTVGLGNVTNESKATMFTNAALTGAPTAPTAANGTNSTQIATTAFVQSAVDSKLAANDAMIFKGTIGTGGTVTALPTTHNAGWTYKVITAGTYAGYVCEVGDMVICITDGTAANDSHWAVVQSNIDGAVTGPASSTANHIVTFSGTTGKVVKDSGYTIATSVPANAVFTDTKVTSVSNHYTPAADDNSALSVDASSTTAATWNSTSLVTGVNLQRDAKGHVTGVTVDSIKMPANPNTDTHHTANNIIGASNTAKANAATTNTTTFLNLVENSVVRSALQITGSGLVSVSASDKGVLTISGIAPTSVDKATNADHATSADSATNATTATKLGSATKGSATKPIYLSSGTATECSTYAGGTAVTLNNSSKAASTASFYAPTAGGTAGYYLKGNGTTSAPVWQAAGSVASGNTDLVTGGSVYTAIEDSWTWEEL